MDRIDAIGTNFEIEWTPSSNGTVSLDLGTGDSASIGVVMNIANGIPNTGVSSSCESNPDLS